MNLLLHAIIAGVAVLLPSLNGWTLMPWPVSKARAVAFFAGSGPRTTKAKPRTAKAITAKAITAKAITAKKNRNANANTDSIVDAEIVVPDVSIATSPSEDNNSYQNVPNETDTSIPRPDKTLLELSLENFADKELHKMRIPFVDMLNQKSIDVRLAFMAEVDGVPYGIGVPCDAAVAILIESPVVAGHSADNDTKTKTTTPSTTDDRAPKTKGLCTNVMRDPKQLEFLSPDDDDNEELMEYMATQLHDHVHKDLRLHRTPRVLTVKGPIDTVTARWKEELLPEPIPVQKLIDPLEEEERHDGGETFFLDFMKRELGETMFNKIMTEDPSQDPELPLTDELMDLFTIPSKEEMDREIYDPDNLEQYIDENFGNIDRDVAGLRLVAFFLKNGRSYSLVQLFTPFTLVARFLDGKFQLLQKQEEGVVIPRLEELYQNDLQKAGLELKL